ncbi:MAG: CDP-alcohol phosphatidyltransferase family protein [Verrucomicrobiaceae bacterium]|nr:CDP-alcohol phosphatidyltransferase family protein [Verrucomicrobiaceae bacterium]
MERPSCEVVISADAPDALIEVCGLSLLERLLRNLQRLGLREVTIASSTPAEIEAHLRQPSWARTEVRWKLGRATSTRRLVIPAAAYYDPRLLRVLLNCDDAAILVDTATGTKCGPEILDERSANCRTIDVAQQPAYLVDLRRDLRPIWFPAPRDEQQRRAAERELLDAAQNGTLDFPARVHAPIETWIIARLCKTRITPNQITLFNAGVSILVTVLFAAGYLWSGTILALIIGVLDGLDGKQARVKVESTKLGKREHAIDYVLELSWWSALASRFSAYGAFVLLVVSDLVDRVAKRAVKKRTGRNLDDVAPVDRFVRLIGGRRNIYVWMFAASLLTGIPDQGFFCMCVWGALTAAVHVVRAFWITRR